MKVRVQEKAHRPEPKTKGYIKQCGACNEVFLDVINFETARWDSIASPCCGTNDIWMVYRSDMEEELHIAGVDTLDQLKTKLHKEGKISVEFPIRTQESN